MRHSPRPNSKRNPNPRNKRLQVTDTDGWTHVTNHAHARRALRKPRRNPDPAGVDAAALAPAEAPRGLTLADLRRQFDECRAVWTASRTWSLMEDVIRRREYDGNLGVEQIISIGLGSPSGFLRGGWVDRRSVSMYQLCGLVCLRELFDTLSPANTNPPKVLAQDPVFNTLDKSLLASLDITVLDHPSAFTLTTQRTLLYCPGAEKAHLEEVLPVQPGIVIGGPLEDGESEVLAAFLDSRRESVKVPGFEACEHAFWESRLYLG